MTRVARPRLEIQITYTSIQSDVGMQCYVVLWCAPLRCKCPTYSYFIIIFVSIPQW